MKSKLVSVCMIAKNCADIVETSLNWATDNFKEINIVVDPENEDNTVEVIESWYPKFGNIINVQYHPFDNFSSQKNRAFTMATKPWVLSVDTDEIYEQNIMWDKLVEVLERTKQDVGAFNIYHIQKDFEHFKPPIELKPRLMKKDVAKMDGKPVDEGIQLLKRKITYFPYAHIHFGHIRNEEALKIKGKDRIKFKDQDSCDGKGLNEHGTDWFIERNKKWNEQIERCPKEIVETIERYYV